MSKEDWKKFSNRLSLLAQRILDELVSEDDSFELAENQEDFSAEAFGAAETIIETLRRFEAGQCDKEALISEAEISSHAFTNIETEDWLDPDFKQRYIEFRRALEDLPEMLEHGQSLGRNYYVYVHKDHDGNVFYVGKGTRKRAWSTDRDSVWQRYVKEKVGGRFEVEIIKNDLHEDEALAIEEETMLKYGNRLLNFAKPLGGIVFAVSSNRGNPQIESVSLTNSNDVDLEENARYWKLRENNRAFVAATKPFEAANTETAVTRYREALLRMREYVAIGRRLSHSPGLRGEYEEHVQQSTGDVATLDRLTLCLAKLNRLDEAVTEAEQHFAEFPADRETSIGQAIVKRIERIKAKAQKNL